jgi:ABC-type antimicrobial peptide transport system permease subunit
VRLRLVAALSASLFQSELIVGESDFLGLFPDDAGYRYFLLEAPPDATPALVSQLETRLGDQGFDVSASADRLAAFAAVENTYLETFQALGGLGLLLGTVGLGAVLLRNALERRRELALARAVGFRRAELRTVILAENMLLLVAGLGLGTLSAAVAVLPAVLERGGEMPVLPVAALLGAVAAAGVLASALAASWVSRFPLLRSLRAD